MYALRLTSPSDADLTHNHLLRFPPYKVGVGPPPAYNNMSRRFPRGTNGGGRSDREFCSRCDYYGGDKPDTSGIVRVYGIAGISRQVGRAGDKTGTRLVWVFPSRSG